MPKIVAAISFALLCSAWPWAACNANDAPTIADLMQLDIKQLTNIRVTTVSRHPQRLIDAASAVQVITQEDIRRSGAASLPEVLRLADNLQVAQKNAHDWAISARGFNTALANKLLVMVDGRTVYTPLFSGVFWDVQDYPLADIDRIEVISGPGGTLWGANAVNGVINIITKSAQETQGLYVDAGGGSQLKAIGEGRYGGQVGSSSYFRVYGKYLDNEQDVLADGAPAFDAWHQERGGFRLDAQPTSQDNLSVHGDIYQGDEQEPAGGVADTSGDNLMARWARRLSASSDMTLQAYVDRTHLDDPVPTLTLGTTPIAPGGLLHDDLTTEDVDFQHRFALGQYTRLIWGVEFRHTRDEVANTGALAFLPAILDQNLYSSFIQDEIPLAPNLNLAAGIKLEHNDYTGWEWQPDMRLRWSPTDQQTLWAAVSRAVRTPSRIDHDLYEAAPPHPLILAGSSDFTSEKLLAYELGYRAQLSERLSGSVSSFYNYYADLRSTSYTPGSIIPFYFANNLEGHTWGLESSADWQVLPRWSLHAGYTLLREDLWIKPGQFDLNAAHNETADPKHQFSVRSALALPRNLQLDAALRWVDTLYVNNGPTVETVPSYFELDSHLAWQLNPRIELSLVGQNLLHAAHPEYGFPGPQRVEIERTVYARLRWSPR